MGACAAPCLLPLRWGGLSNPALARGPFCARELILNVSSPASRPRVFCRFSSWGLHSVFLNLLWQRKHAGCPTAGAEAFCCPDPPFLAELNFHVSRYSRCLLLPSMQRFGGPKAWRELVLEGYLFVFFAYERWITALLIIAVREERSTMIKLCETETSTPFSNGLCTLVHSIFYH